MKSYINMSDYSVEERNKRALDDLVWRVMENEKGRPFDLVDFLAEQKDLAELVSGPIIRGSERAWYDLMNVIESRLLAYLEDSKWVEDRAIEMAQEDS